MNQWPEKKIAEVIFRKANKKDDMPGVTADHVTEGHMVEVIFVDGALCRWWFGDYDKAKSYYTDYVIEKACRDRREDN